ncbi:uncharacterized protein LOC129693844 [Leucoraja erinacea]|uniref:uncharacterized protein LOC129693844 n=1 Tax=Leucoraja erinaceus TaxID=7782 RepID=UPI002456D531|nr:uncharacterized protein LOC129693844 [Leucoraja erinacea]
MNCDPSIFSTTGKTSTEHNLASLPECSYIEYSPTAIPNRSSCKYVSNVLCEEGASQDIAEVNSNIKPDSSMHNKYKIEHYKPSSDLEYDPLVNYCSNLKPICKKVYMEMKHESIEQGPETEHSLASETMRNFQSIEAEESSEDELVIDVPNLPPLALNPRTDGRIWRKGDENLPLIRKVKPPNVEGSLGKPVSNFTDLCLETDSREIKMGVATLQSKQPFATAECSIASTITSVQMSEASCYHKCIQLASNTKCRGDPLNLRLVQMENTLAPINVKRPNRKTGPEYASQKLGMSVQKRGKAKEQTSFRPKALKLSGCTGQLSGDGSPSLKVGQMTFTEVRCNELETSSASCADKLGRSLKNVRACVKSPDQVGPFGNDTCGGSLQTTSWDDEESSLSSEDLELSDSDPMEECLRIFNEFSEQEVKANKSEIEQVFVVYFPCFHGLSRKLNVRSNQTWSRI